MEYSKDQLLAMSEVVLQKLKVNRFKRIFICVGLIVILIAVAFVITKMRPDDSDFAHTITYVAIAVNTAIVGFTVPGIFKAFFGKSVFEEYLEKYKKGEISDEKFYTNFILDSMKLLHTDINKIEQLAGINK